MRGIVAVLLFVCKSISAQTTLGGGTLRGTVLDAADRLVAGARIALTETSKGLVRTTGTTGDGTFLFLSVLAGNYSVRVDMAGFATEQMDGLRIEVGQQASIVIRLHVGDVQTSVTVMPP